MKKSAGDISQLDYEQALRELEQVTSQLETEQLPLEKMLELYARGQSLANRCNQLLDEAELKVKTLQPGNQLGNDSE
jgi:exodeoxyribonuclease VII small subunit